MGRKTKLAMQPMNLDLNVKAVWGSISVGMGHSPLDELLSIMDVAPLSGKCFSNQESILGRQWQVVLQQQIDEAAREEVALARMENRVYAENDGEYAWTIGIVDGGWSQRSYGHRYSAKSGCAVIVGFYTKKILFLSVRNKYCSVCAQAEKSEDEPRPHSCFRNWSGPSTAMEADIIVEGFKFCEREYKLRFNVNVIYIISLTLFMLLFLNLFITVFLDVHSV